MEVFGHGLGFIASSLARIGVRGKQLVAPSADLSPCALEFQIELRARLLQDIELVRSQLGVPDSGAFRYRVHNRHSDRRRRHRLSLSAVRRSKLISAMGRLPDRQAEIALRFQLVNPNE